MEGWRMIKSLLDAEIRDGTPRILGEQPWVKALSLAVLELHRRTMGYIDLHGHRHGAGRSAGRTGGELEDRLVRHGV